MHLGDPLSNSVLCNMSMKYDSRRHYIVVCWPRSMLEGRVTLSSKGWIK